jgi:hypothetical protein
MCCGDPNPEEAAAGRELEKAVRPSHYTVSVGGDTRYSGFNKIKLFTKTCGCFIICKNPDAGCADILVFHVFEKTGDHSAADPLAAPNRINVQSADFDAFREGVQAAGRIGSCV